MQAEDNSDMQAEDTGNTPADGTSDTPAEDTGSEYDDNGSEYDDNGSEDDDLDSILSAIRHNEGQIGIHPKDAEKYEGNKKKYEMYIGNIEECLAKINRILEKYDSDASFDEYGSLLKDIKKKELREYIKMINSITFYLYTYPFEDIDSVLGDEIQPYLDIMLDNHPGLEEESEKEKFRQCMHIFNTLRDESDESIDSRVNESSKRELLSLIPPEKTIRTNALMSIIETAIETLQDANETLEDAISDRNRNDIKTAEEAVKVAGAELYGAQQTLARVNSVEEIRLDFDAEDYLENHVASKHELEVVEAAMAEAAKATEATTKAAVTRAIVKESLAEAAMAVYATDSVNTALSPPPPARARAPPPPAPAAAAAPPPAALSPQQSAINPRVSTPAGRGKGTTSIYPRVSTPARGPGGGKGNTSIYPRVSTPAGRGKGTTAINPLDVFTPSGIGADADAADADASKESPEIKGLNKLRQVLEEALHEEIDTSELEEKLSNAKSSLAQNQMKLSETAISITEKVLAYTKALQAKAELVRTTEQLAKAQEAVASSKEIDASNASRKAREAVAEAEARESERTKTQYNKRNQRDQTPNQASYDARIEADSARREADSARREADSARREAASARKEADEYTISQAAADERRDAQETIEEAITAITDLTNELEMIHSAPVASDVKRQRSETKQNSETVPGRSLFTIGV